MREQWSVAQNSQGKSWENIEKDKWDLGTWEEIQVWGKSLSKFLNQGRGTHTVVFVVPT